MESFNNFCTDNNIKLETTSNFDLINYAKQLKIKYFQSYFMNDELPKRIKTNKCAIVNLQKSDQDGSHWCCYWKKGKEKYYFDSYGLEPCNEMLKYLKPTKNVPPLIISTYQIQKFGTVICGQICIYVLYMLGNNHKFIDILLSLMNEFHPEHLGGDLNEDFHALEDIATIVELL